MLGGQKPDFGALESGQGEVKGWTVVMKMEVGKGVAGRTVVHHDSLGSGEDPVGERSMLTT